MRPLVLVIVLVGMAQAAAAQVTTAQKLDVKIIDRQDKEDEYSYAAVYNNVAVGKSFKVHGATFTLQLPDGRLAIVNCESKFAEHMAGRVGNRRSCRTPLVDSIQADFNGDNAKLIWPVSLDGKKTQSETYKVLAILDKPSAATYQAAPSGNATPQDLFVWFDESAPGPGAPLFEAVVTARAYDEALAILRQARQGNTSVQAGTNVLDTDYHPATISLEAWQKGNPKSSPSLF